MLHEKYSTLTLPKYSISVIKTNLVDTDMHPLRDLKKKLKGVSHFI